MNQPRASSRRTFVAVLGAMLLGAAVWTVAEHRVVATSAWSALRHPAPVWLFSLPTAVLCAFALTSLSLQLLTNRVARLSTIGFTEMFALTLASALGNLAPVQAGLIGRIAYQHRVHDIPVPVSVLLAIQSTLLTLVAGGWLAVSLLAVRRLASVSWLAAPATYLLLACALADPGWRRSTLLQALLLRCGEVLLAGLRVHAAFTLTGCSIDPLTSLALGAAGNLSNAIPFLGGALGVREWIVAGLAPAIAGVTTPEALAAELLSRLVEIVIVMAGGLLATPILARRVAEAARAFPIPKSDDLGGASGFQTWHAAFRSGALPQAHRSPDDDPLSNTPAPPSS